MRIIAQRAKNSFVTIEGDTVGSIESGLVLLLGVGREDTEEDIDFLVGKVVNLRIFEDGEGKMNESLLETGGEILLVSQFTLYADCRKGRRPSFTDAGDPAWAKDMFTDFVQMVDETCAVSVSSGIFGADMDVRLCNWGPVTIILDSANLFSR